MLKLPVLRSLIKRRLLVNYRVDPFVISKLLPAPFQPLLVDGAAVAGVCLIHLQQVRPAFASALPFGVSSQNAAHRIAVTWIDGKGADQQGVYLFRRDTASTVVQLAGGRLFPGVHHGAVFKIEQDDDAAFDFAMTADDGLTVSVRGVASSSFPTDSCFRSVQESSAFFEAGSLGYSPAIAAGHAEGFILDASTWRVEPFQLTDVRASFYDDTETFPRGSVVFDHALMMREVDARWRAAPDIDNA